MSLEEIRKLPGMTVCYGRSGILYINNYPVLDNSWAKENRMVAHAFGQISEYTYTNSLEAFEYNYAQGHRVFEVDFMMTSEGVPVAGHDWAHFYSISGRGTSEDAIPLSLEEFKSSKICGQYTPLSFADVVQLLIDHPDMYIITDTKDTRDPEISQTFRSLVALAQEMDSEVLNRVIPQIYNNEMYEIISQFYDWKSVVYTLYNQGAEFDYKQVFDYAYQHGINVFTTYSYRSDDLFFEKVLDTGGLIYMHTYNDADSVVALLQNKEIWGVYTDCLPYDALDGYPYPYTD